MPDSSPLSDVSTTAPFVGRHVGPRDDEIARMLEVVEQPSLEALVDAAVPTGIRSADRSSTCPQPSPSWRHSTSCGRWPAATSGRCR